MERADFSPFIFNGLMPLNASRIPVINHLQSGLDLKSGTPLATLLVAAQFVWAVPLILPSWYAGRALVAVAIPSAMAAWALWVILSAQRWPATESVG
jgi:hypothetical protein